MRKDKLKLGIISEIELVNIFATPSQSQKYYSVNRFTGRNKNILLNEVNRYCTITDLGNRQYEIYNVNEYPLPKVYDKMNKSLYQYIVPLILNKLIDGHDKNNKINLTYNKWARQIQMINGNYNIIKYHKQKAGDYLGSDYKYIDDFYSKADDMITNYLETGLKYLKESGTIIWREVYMVHTENVSDKIIEVDNNNNVYTEFTIDEHQATQEDMDYYSRCIEVADKIAGIDKSDSDRDRYYGKKAFRFSQALSTELNKKNIKYIYKTYEVYYINLDKCKFLLSKFNINESTITNFNSDFQKLIMDNANKRYKKKELDQIKKYSEDYIDTFFNLCEITINDKTEAIRDRLNLSDSNPEGNYNLKFKIKRSIENNGV